MSTVVTLGPVGFKPTGAYNNTREYKKLDVVIYQGSSYVAKSDSIGQLPTNTTYWNCIAEKGSKGDPGAIKFEVVQTLPTTDIEDDTIYLVPITPDAQGNNYEEYIYVNNQWELLGKIGVTPDLSNYYTKTETNTLLNDKVGFTDYATSSTGGVIKVNMAGFNATNGVPSANVYNYTNYQNAGTNIFIGKGTLENVITGKDLTTKAYVDGLVGDIANAIDLINGEEV